MIAGGMESMSCSRHAVHMRPGVKFGDVAMEEAHGRKGRRRRRTAQTLKRMPMTGR